MPTAKPKTLPAAMFAVQGEITKIAKDGKNPHFGSAYTTLPALIEALNPILQKHGLLLSQIMDNVDGRASLRTVLYHVESDTQIEGNCPFPDGINAQQTGAATSYYRRYGLQSLLGIVSDDDDGNLASRPQATPNPVVAEAQATYDTPVNETLPAASGTALGGGVVL